MKSYFSFPLLLFVWFDWLVYIIASVIVHVHDSINVNLAVSSSVLNQQV